MNFKEYLQEAKTLLIKKGTEIIDYRGDSFKPYKNITYTMKPFKPASPAVKGMKNLTKLTGPKGEYIIVTKQELKRIGG